MVWIIVLIILSFASLFLFVSEKIFERTTYYKKNYSETDKLKGKDKVDFINTGSTFAFYGIDYESAGVKGLNLALCPQSLEADFRMLKHFEKRYNKGAVVFIVISDLAFIKSSYVEARINEKYYRVLSAKEIEEYNLFKAIRAKYFPVIYNWKNFLRFHWDLKVGNEFKLSVNENDREAVEADSYKRCQSWMQEFGLNNLSDARQSYKFNATFEYTTGILKDMVTWCQERGYKPLVVNLPVSSEMEKSFSEEFQKAFYYDHVDKVGNVPFFDMKLDSRLHDYLLYLDSCRLNRVGREIITKLLLLKAEKTE